MLEYIIAVIGAAMVIWGIMVKNGWLIVAGIIIGSGGAVLRP